ncbi:hypothetical protein EDC96DRAFT_150518 [Choanephora cucurbitarum]|nr:hypothetical protein EDC96DRAFT_150518 [Choanephora cucurbitarum]
MSALVENETHAFEPVMPSLLHIEEESFTFSSSSQRQSTDSESIKTSSSFPLVTPPELVEEPTLSHVIEIVNLENETMTEPIDKKKSSFARILQRKPSMVLSSSNKTRAAELSELTPSSSSETMVSQHKRSSNQQMDTFVAFLRTSAATTYKKVTNTDLVRSRSKRTWSIQLKPSTSTNSIPQHNQKRSSISKKHSLDPSLFLSSPEKPKRKEDKKWIEHHLIFVHVLHETMIHGGYLLPHLYVPMELWYQSNVRIPAIDTKILACDMLINQLEEMDRCDLTDKVTIESSLAQFEKSLLCTSKTMKRKLGGLSTTNKISRSGSIRTTPTVTKMTKMYGFDNNDSNSSINSLLNQQPAHHSPTPNTTSTSTKSLESIVEGATAGLKNSPQTFTSWGSKLSKSVEKINQRNNHNDQNEVYIKSLVQLFLMTDVLEKWKVEMESKISTEEFYSTTSAHISHCAELFSTVVCGFVMKDYELFLEKWLKQSTDWLLN